MVDTRFVRGLTGTGSNDEYLDSANDFAMAVGVSGIILHFFPKFMRPYVHCALHIHVQKADSLFAYSAQLRGLSPFPIVVPPAFR